MSIWQRLFGKRPGVTVVVQSPSPGPKVVYPIAFANAVYDLYHPKVSKKRKTDI